MDSPASRKKEIWPRKVKLGRVTVTVYQRKTPLGKIGFMVANYAQGKRRFDSYPTEEEALGAANKLARQLSEREVVAAAMTNEQAADYASAVQSLEPFKVSLPSAASTLADCLKIVGDLPSLQQAVKFYTARHKQTKPKRVADVVAELLEIKASRGASARYSQDLRFRLGRFAEAFQKDTCNVTTAEVQEWLDSQKASPQSYANFRRVVHLFFGFAVARGYAADNPVTGADSVKVRGGEIEIFTPAEIARLLGVASPEFLPSLAIGAFAGLRSAEIERLEWSDVDLAGRHIVVGASRAKTAARRVVPVSDNLAAWLVPYAGREGRIWPGGHDAFYDAQQATAAATEIKEDSEQGSKHQKPVKWKSNGLRHSYASYRFALTGDAGRVAGELGNSASVVHRHYRELVKPNEAQNWFSVTPEQPANVTPLPQAVNS